MKNRKRVLIAALANVFVGSAIAAVSADEAKQLGGPVLTEWGAERAGNKEGTIPAWTPERIKTPAAYDPKEPGQTPDPWPDEKPLYSITAQNMDKYADKLTDGQKEMLKKYPTFRMDVYPTHRTVQFPKWVLENTIKNATSAHTLNGGVKLEGAYGGVPFPIPKTGNEVIWNHLLVQSPPGIAGVTEVFMVDVNGNKVLQGLEDVHYQFPFWDPTIPGIRTPDSNYWVLRFDALAPPRKVGEKYIIINALDPINPGQRVWLYVPGQRRVKLSPDLAYDTPNPVSGGAATMDESQGFLGAQDRFDFKLVGKQERYVIVNNDKIQDYKACPTEKAFLKGFENPDCTRFELHRTWRVELTLKPGYRNIMPKRTLWTDEDWSGAAVADCYDAGGKIYRVDYNPISLLYQYPEQQYQFAHSAITYDLQTGIYLNSSWMGFKEGSRWGGYVVAKPQPMTFFSPEALAGEGIR